MREVRVWAVVLVGGVGGGDGYGGEAGGLKLAQLRHITRPDRCLPACLCAYVCVQMRVRAYVRVSCTLRPFGTALAPPVLVAAAVVSKSEVPQAARSLSSGHRDARLARAAGRTPQIEKGGPSCQLFYYVSDRSIPGGGRRPGRPPSACGDRPMFCFCFVSAICLFVSWVLYFCLFLFFEGGSFCFLGFKLFTHSSRLGRLRAYTANP